MAEQLPPPTRMVLQVYKGKKVGADKGFKLLKNKADALKAKFRDICKRIHETKMGMSEQSSVACFSLTQVRTTTHEEGYLFIKLKLNHKLLRIFSTTLHVDLSN